MSTPLTLDGHVIKVRNLRENRALRGLYTRNEDKNVVAPSLRTCLIASAEHDIFNVWKLTRGIVPNDLVAGE